MMFSSEPGGDGVERVADPGGDRVVRAPGLRVELPLGGPHEEDGRALEQGEVLDEVGLPLGGAEEAGPATLGAGVVPLAVDDQVDDADGAERADDLAEPLVGVPVAHQRPGEVRLEELEVRRRDRGAEEDERREDEPVHHAHDRPLEHPCVQHGLLEHGQGAAGRVVAASDGRLAAADRGEHAAHGGHEHGQRGDGQRQRDDDRNDLHEGGLLGWGSDAVEHGRTA